MPLENLDHAVDVVKAERRADHLGRLARAKRRSSQELAFWLARGGCPRGELSPALVGDAVERAADQRAALSASSRDLAKEGVGLGAERTVVGPRYPRRDRLLVGAPQRSLDQDRLVKHAPHAGEQLRTRGVHHERRVPGRVSQQREVVPDLAIDVGHEAVRGARPDCLDEPHRPRPLRSTG